MQDGKRVSHSLLEPTVDDEVVYYNVQGSSLSEVAHYIRTNGPKDWQGRSWGGMAGSSLRWEWYRAPEWSGCRVAAADVRLHSRITLPRWAMGSLPNFGVGPAWEGYLKALTTHENGHRDINIEEAREVKAGLLEIPRMEDCEQVQAAALAVAAKAQARRVLRNRQYDAITMHGQTQGATF
jgi:predicted secreted Zn-dependent protease